MTMETAGGTTAHAVFASTGLRHIESHKDPSRSRERARFGSCATGGEELRASERGGLIAPKTVDAMPKDRAC
jgi:hypothetical protein